MKIYLTFSGIVLYIMSEKVLKIDEDFSPFLLKHADNPDLTIFISWNWKKAKRPASLPAGSDLIQTYYKENGNCFCEVQDILGTVSSTCYSPDFSRCDCTINADIYPEAVSYTHLDRIHLLSETVRSIRGELSQVTDKFNQIDYNNISSVYDSAASSVCKSCDHCLSCWDTRYNEIMDAFGPLDKVLRQNGMVTAEALPRYFKESCRKTDALCRAINTRYRAFLSRESSQRQIRESQQLMFDNLYTIGDTLSALEETLRAPEEEETATRTAAERAFRKLDEPFTSMDAKRTSGGSLHLTVCTNAEPAHAAGELCVAVSEETGVLFSSAAIFSSGTCCRILFAQDAVYQTENGVQQIARSGNHVCGDSVSTFSDAFGNHCFLLSDGMGSGGRAAIDSLMTCSMLKRLLCAGFGTSAAFRLINLSLIHI